MRNGRAKNAAKKPMLHKMIEPIRMRLFQRWARLHAKASVGSVGQARPGRNIIQADSSSMAPENANTQALCWLKVINMGKVLVKEATVAPMPNVTNVIGSAQQTNVPLVANKAVQLTPVSLFI